MTSSFEITILVDNTYSMQDACQGIDQTLPEIQATVNLLVGRPAVRLAVYGDFDDVCPNHQQGGYSMMPLQASLSQQQEWIAEYLRPYNGRDWPEALITALNLYRAHTPADIAKLLIILTDAPPHVPGQSSQQAKAEFAYLKKHNLISDWDTLCQVLQDQHHTRVVTLLFDKNYPFYRKLGHVVLTSPSTDNVRTYTKRILMHMLSLEKHFDFPPLTSVDLDKSFKQADPQFVLESFQRLLQPGRPQSLLALTTNPVLGKYWRAICSVYRHLKNGKYSNQCQAIINQFSKSKSNLNARDSLILDQWLKQSHIDVEAVQAIIQKALDQHPTQFICLPSQVTLQDTSEVLDSILQLARVGDPRQVSHLIAQLELTDQPDRRSIPMQYLTPQQIFSLIPHLLCPGAMIHGVGVYFVATLALKNRYLHSLAHQLLADRPGHWIDLSKDPQGRPHNPVFFSLQCARLLSTLPDQYLQPEQKKFFLKYKQVDQVSRNLHLRTIISTGKQLKEDPGPSYWVTCQECQQLRCFSHMMSCGQKCIFCHYLPHETVPNSNPQTKWVNCQDCAIRYSVTSHVYSYRYLCPLCRQEATNVKSRQQVTQCHLCAVEYLADPQWALQVFQQALAEPDKYCAQVPTNQKEKMQQLAQQGHFCCPLCVANPGKQLKNYTVSYMQLLDANPQAQVLVPYKPYQILCTNDKLYKRLDQLQEQSVPSQLNMILRYNHFPIVRSAQLLEKLVHQIINSNGLQTCAICINDRPAYQIKPACGQCPYDVCQECLDQWYGQVKSGSLVLQSYVNCPFCKQVPKYDLVKHLPLGHVRNVRPTSTQPPCKWLDKWYYALCRQCLMVKSCQEKACVSDVPDVNNSPRGRNDNNFRCSDCQPLPTITVDSKPCPTCQVQVERTGGCHHITCQCGTHWCWVCGQSGDQQYKSFDEQTIYSHMNKCGGVFPID